VAAACYEWFKLRQTGRRKTTIHGFPMFSIHGYPNSFNPLSVASNLCVVIWPCQSAWSSSVPVSSRAAWAQRMEQLVNMQQGMLWLMPTCLGLVPINVHLFAGLLGSRHDSSLPGLGQQYMAWNVQQNMQGTQPSQPAELCNHLGAASR
jgi:hypothetical protein